TPTPTPYLRITFKDTSGANSPQTYQVYSWTCGSVTGGSFNSGCTFPTADCTLPITDAGYSCVGAVVRNWNIPNFVGVTPVPSGNGYETISNSVLGKLYGWQKWNTGGRTLNFIVAIPTSTPTPTPISPLITNALITNGGFENQLSLWSCKGGVSGSCTPDSAVKYSGTYSGKVYNSGGGWGWQLAQRSPAVKNGNILCLSGKVKKNEATAWAAIALQETGGSYREKRVDASNTTSWQPLNLSFTIPSDWILPVQVFLRVFNQGGTAWFDDISLTPGACK
ncbi:MAG: carbohydrate binding domain-containing protein, partial [Candidatus Daviesbacteria bacterium]